MTSVHIAWRGLVLGSALLVATAHGAAADILILESKAAPYKRGEQLPGNARLTIPAGASVRILRPSGRMQEIRGYFDRTVKELTAGEAVNQTIWQQFKDQLRDLEPSAGGTAATRSMKADKDRTVKP